jgi:hypothetical protein
VDDRRIKVVDEWKDVCVYCEQPARLVLLECGPRWSAREVFGRSWHPHREFAVHCRTCGSAMPVPREQLAAAIERHERALPAEAGTAAAAPHPAPTGAVPAQRVATDAVAVARQEAAADAQ